MNASGQSRLLHLLLHPHVKFVAGVGFLPHHCVFGGRLVLFHARPGRLFQTPANHLLAIDRSLPRAAEALLERGVLGLFLPVKILKLASNLNHPRKVPAVFRAQLRPFLF